MPPSISIREHVRWLPEPASEPTATLVLTSGGNRFVDIRILKPRESDESKQQGRWTAFSHVLPPARLDWAFAGTSKSEPRQDSEGKAYSHSTWMHWVSNRTRDVDGVSDEGDMFPQGGGRVLEKGSMVNPDTGEVTEYEEMWFDPEVKAVPVKGNGFERGGQSGGETVTAGSGIERAGNGRGAEDAKPRVCVVMQLHDDEHEARGVVVRVGQHVQGILRVGEQLSLERWEWKGVGKHEGWQRQVRMGDLWLPCGAAMDEARLKEGGEVRYGDYLWKVLELEHF
ncbi:hypothetical protein LTR53_010906 [Teratosphaeriaceae sp. CCFEE 6253]|nr:hypothetical protein LTR53_010906 [Teratosphaeriaceae sp. CCFEE 6253]